MPHFSILSNFLSIFVPRFFWVKTFTLGSHLMNFSIYDWRNAACMSKIRMNVTFWHTHVGEIHSHKS